MANPDGRQANDSGPAPWEKTSGRPRWPIVVACVVVVGLVVAGALWWYLRDDAPAEVDLQTAAASVTTVAGAPAEPVTLEGEWTVDTATGTHDFETATGSFAGFRVEEELSGIGSTTAVGRTGDVAGTMTIEDDTVTVATFTVDLTTIVTDRDRRDDRVQDALDTDRFREAMFELTEPIDLPADAESGAEIAVDAVGELTIHGVTNPVTIPLEAKLTGNTVVVVGSVELTFSDYGIDAPRAPIVLSVDDHAVLELQLLLTRS